MLNNQGNSKPEGSQKENGDMASEWEELVELDDVQLATIVGGGGNDFSKLPNWLKAAIFWAGGEVRFQGFIKSMFGVEWYY